MDKKSDKLDLDLWADENLIRRQNQLKYQFWEVLGAVGDEFPKSELSLYHCKVKGKKLAQGQDLMGLPYQVLDIFRDFDLEQGLNIRLLNWFGKGVYLFVLCGTNLHANWELEELDFQRSWTSSPWDYSELLLEEFSENENLNYIQWFKRLPVSSALSQNKKEWSEAIRKVLNSLQTFLAKKQK